MKRVGVVPLKKNAIFPIIFSDVNAGVLPITVVNELLIRFVRFRVFRMNVNGALIIQAECVSALMSTRYYSFDTAR